MFLFRPPVYLLAVSLSALCSLPASATAQTIYFMDQDGDGFGVTGSAVSFPSDPGPAFSLIDGDCNDSDAFVFPGAFELADNIDNNCNAVTDDGTGPVLSFVGGTSQTATVGQPFTLDMSAVSFNGAPNSFTIVDQGTPAGAFFSQLTPNGAQVTWTPTASQVGANTLSFQASSDINGFAVVGSVSVAVAAVPEPASVSLVAACCALPRTGRRRASTPLRLSPSRAS